MQTIARANRVFSGKHSGMIVDNANVFASLERALAIYAQGRDGNLAVRDQKALVDELRQAVADATAYCKARGVDLASIGSASAEKFERAQAVEDGANVLLAPECGLRSRTDSTRACRALTQKKRTKQSAMRCSSTCTNRTWVTARVRTPKQRRRHGPQHRARAPRLGVSRHGECHPSRLCVACPTAICLRPLARTKLERRSR